MIQSMKFRMLLFALAGILVMSGCRVSDVRTLTVAVPGMVAESDVQRIQNALAPLNGIEKDKAVFDVKSRKITVSYDSMVIAHKNIEIAIAEAGYEANGIAAIKPSPTK